MARTRRVACLVVTAAAAIGAVPAIRGPASANVTRGCVGHFDAATDYFPHRATIEDALNFRVEYRKSFKVVTVDAAHRGGAEERYLLVQCGTPRPVGEPAAAVVTVPIASLFAASPTHLSPLVDLGRLDVLAGVSRLKDLAGDRIAGYLAASRVREFAPGSVIDSELVVSSRPALLMTAGGVAPAAAIRAAGIPSVANMEWLEETALARAEWMKFLALFLNEERQAETLYRAMKARYRALSARALAASPKPLVLTGRSTNGRFVIAGGRSYVAALIHDAGGRYVWADNGARGTAAVDLEAQLQRAANADIWINGGGWTSLAQMRQDEPRYAAFKAWRDGQVWVYERRLTRSGGNEYWTRSVSHPDLVLADLVSIFHPRLTPDHTLEWYMPVPPR